MALPTTQRPAKARRGKEILLALVKLYIETGKPVGSSTLKESNFDQLSSATLRNYFAELEEEGYLLQHHTSGGRIPTSKAYRFYANSYQAPKINTKQLPIQESKQIQSLLHKSSETLSEKTGLAVFLSSPRFAQDFIQWIRFIPIEEDRFLAVILTDYGQIKTESIYTTEPVTPSFIDLTERYFLWRWNKGEKPEFPNEREQKHAQRIYTEILLRHAANYSGIHAIKIHKTGLSKLINYPDMDDTGKLSKILCFFEDDTMLFSLLEKSCLAKEMRAWIGDELVPVGRDLKDFSIVAIPYFINQVPAGAVAILGPTRLDYHKLFTSLTECSLALSQTLTKSSTKFKIPFLSPFQEADERLEQTTSLLLEDKHR